MKKLSLLLLLFALVFTGCSDDDDKDVLVVNFENKLTEANSELIVEEKPAIGATKSTTFQDNSEAITFPHSYTDWGYGDGYAFSQFTYTNKTDNSGEKSIAAITKKGKVGTTYLSVYPDFSPAEFTINNPTIYKIKEVWVTNSTWAYNSMTAGDDFAKAFKKGDWFKLTATGYSKTSSITGNAEIYLANYKSDDDKPISEWIKFDLTPLKDAVKVVFELSSTDNSEYEGNSYMNTPSYFCMDGITLEEK